MFMGLQPTQPQGIKDKVKVKYLNKLVFIFLVVNVVYLSSMWALYR